MGSSRAWIDDNIWLNAEEISFSVNLHTKKLKKEFNLWDNTIKALQTEFKEGPTRNCNIVWRSTAMNLLQQSMGVSFPRDLDATALELLRVSEEDYQNGINIDSASGRHDNRTPPKKARPTSRAFLIWKLNTETQQPALAIFLARMTGASRYWLFAFSV